MGSPVDNLKSRLLEMSSPDQNGCYLHGQARRRQRTEFVQQCLRELWNQARTNVSFEVPEQGVALAAVGSLARGQLGPSSDLDLVLVYESNAIKDAQLNEFANALWYPLWDSGLDLDHSVRTRQQCEAVTDKDLPAAMGWLFVKPMAGHQELVTQTASSILQRWRKAARKRLPELLESARSRFDEFGHIAYLNQPDIKQARGGLRDSVLVSALVASWLADRPHGYYDEAVEQLLDIRDCIHLITGKDHDVLLSEYQPQVAAMLGLADPTLPEDERIATSIDDLQTVIAHLGRQIAFALDLTSSHAEHSLTTVKPRFPVFKLFDTRANGKREAPVFEPLAPGVVMHEGEVSLAPNANPSKDPQLALRVAVAAGENLVPISIGTLSSLSHCPISDSGWDEASRALFIRLLSTGSQLVSVWEQIDSVNIPSRWVPEWSAVRNRPSASAAHRYTIDRHMVEVASRLGRESPTGEPYDDQHFQALLLAGIFHDIGKRPRIADHALEGARHVPVILSRMGYDAETIRMATLLVREHLTLSEFSTTKDPNDPKVAAELASRVDNDENLLDMLFDLTRADGSSLGATAAETISKHYGWSKWRQATVTMMTDAARVYIRQHAA